MANTDPGMLKAGGDSWTGVSALYPHAGQNIAFSGTAALNTAFDTRTRCVRCIATGGSCRIAIGPAPTADANDLLLPEGAPEYFAISEGDQLSVLQDSGAGVLNVTEMKSIGM